MRRYTVVLTAEPDGSACNVVAPALPGCFTWGTTIDEALAMARDAIAPHLDGEAPSDFPAPGDAVITEMDVAIAETDGVLRAAEIAIAAGA